MQYVTIGLAILIDYLQSQPHLKFKSNVSKYQIECEIHPFLEFNGLNVAELIQDLVNHIGDEH